jgi:hypothetical protein
MDKWERTSEIEQKNLRESPKKVERLEIDQGTKRMKGMRKQTYRYNKYINN